MRNIQNRQKRSFAAQKLIHRRDGLRPRDPIARLLPRFKPAVTRNRTKYSRKGRAAQQLRQALRCSKGPVSDTPPFTPLSTVTHGAAIRIARTPSASIVNRRLLHGAKRAPRCAKRAPCAFTETAVKRAIKAVRAAGETPGRIIVTKDGFTVEFANGDRASPDLRSPSAPTAPAAGSAAAGGTGGDAIATPRATANLWDEKLLPLGGSGVQQ